MICHIDRTIGFRVIPNLGVHTFADRQIFILGHGSTPSLKTTFRIVFASFHGCVSVFEI